MGRNFYFYPCLQPKATPAQSYATQCKSFSFITYRILGSQEDNDKLSPQTDCNIKKDSNEVSNSSLGIKKEEKSNNDVSEEKNTAPSTMKIITYKCKVCAYETPQSSESPTTDMKKHMVQIHEVDELKTNWDRYFQLSNTKGQLNSE